MENYHNKKVNFSSIFLYGVLLIVAIIIVYFYYSLILPYFVSIIDEPKEEVLVNEQSLYEEFLKGNSESAATKVEGLMQKNYFAADEAVDLKLLYANFIYRNSDYSDKLKALNIVSNIIEEPTVSPVDRAKAIRLLVNFAYADTDLFASGNESFLYKLDFAPLNNFNKDYTVLVESSEHENWHESLKILAEYAHSIEPHSYTAMLLASWYSGQLSYVEDGSAVDDYVDLIDGYVVEADELLEKESKSSYVSPGLQWNKVNFYYWKGEVLANLEIMNLPHDQSFEKAFSRAIELQDFLNISNQVTYADLSMTARFIYAIYLNEIYGEERVGDINELLESFVDISNSNTRANDNFTNLASYLEDTHDYFGTSVYELTMINRGFRDYMIGLGWDFGATD